MEDSDYYRRRESLFYFVLFYIKLLFRNVFWLIYSHGFTIYSITLICIFYNDHKCDFNIFKWLTYVCILFIIQSIITIYHKYVYNPEYENHLFHSVITCIFSLSITVLCFLFVIAINIVSDEYCKTDLPQIYNFTIVFIVFGSMTLGLPLLLFLLVIGCSGTLQKILDKLEAASEKDLDKLGIFVYNTEENHAFNSVNNITIPLHNEKNCVICFKEYENNVLLRVLPCNNSHHFHKECIDRWLKLKKTCPYCRKNITDIDSDIENNIPN